MVRYLLGVLLVCMVVGSWALRMQPHMVPESWWVAAMLIALPVGAAWAVAEVVDRWSPRRAFDARLRRGWVLFGAGLASAALAYVIATVMLAVVGWLPDAGAMVVSTACTSGLVLLMCLARKQGGLCVRCQYELGEGQARCPECGMVGSRA